MSQRTGIFISHAHADAGLAKLLVDLIEVSLGPAPGQITCTSDDEHGLLSGAPLLQQLKARLNTAAVLILLSTKNSAGKDWVEYEVAHADAQQIPIHVVTPSEVFRDTIPEPHRERVSVTLGNPEQVLAFVDQIGAQVPNLQRSAASPMALARLVQAARREEIDHYKAALGAAAQQREAEAQHREDVVRDHQQLLAHERRSWRWAVAAIGSLAIVTLAFLYRDYDHRVGAIAKTAESACEQRLSRLTYDLNRQHTEALKRFALSGRLVSRGNPLGNARFDVYQNLDGSERPLATRETDGGGVYTFKEGELPIDPSDYVSFVVRLASGRVVKTVRPLDARLDIEFVQ